MISIPVHTLSRAYEVHVASNILSEVGHLATTLTHAKRALVISDTNVEPLWSQPVVESLTQAGITTSVASFPAGEKSKRLATVEQLLDVCVAHELTRDDCVVALGGGVCGDMSGLVAGLYLRGIAIIQVPTTLLAMVDSSVGGKTAVDLAGGKNLAGLFLQPHAVIADIKTLHTLSPQQLQDGCGEVIKHAVLADPTLLAELVAHPLTSPDVSDEQLARVVARNIEIKRDVVDADEHEHGERQKLNLGHTIGHAIEAASGYTLGHGSCVAAGLCYIVRAATKLGWCKDPELAARVEATVIAHGLPTTSEFSADELFSFATHDKKRHGSTVNVVVPERAGQCNIRRVTLEQLAEIIRLGEAMHP